MKYHNVRYQQAKQDHATFLASNRSRTVFICPVCTQRFRSDDLYKSHYREIHSKKVVR